ncbi:MAG TPA: DUF2723 domain-containing protein [Chloroflexia bacterium]|nr:DUF2723 domain-containing protein [Chloroflexia bacterium]
MDKALWPVGLAGLAVALGALALYVATLAPDVLVGDSGEFQFTGAILGVPHPTGYPLYTLLSKLATTLPFGNVAYRINLSSAIYTAAAAGILTVLVWQLAGWLMPAAPGRGLRAALVLAAVAIGGLWAVAGTVWAQAVVARTYALNGLLVAACLTAWLLWWRTQRRASFLAGALLLGLSLAHHGTTVMLLPGYVLLAALGEWASPPQPWPARRRRWLEGLAAVALGLSPLLFLAYRFVFGYSYYWGNPQSWADVWFLARGGPFAGQIFAYPFTVTDQAVRVALGGEQIARQFGVTGLLLGLAGLARLLLDRRTRGAGVSLAVLLIGSFGFAINYGIIGHIYLIPTYLFWALFMAAAATWPFALAARVPAGRVRQVLQTGTVLALAVGALLVPAGLAAARLPDQDRSADTQVRDMARETLALAETGARISVDWESLCVFRYYRLVEGRRTDLELYSEDPRDWYGRIAEDLARGRPTYVGGFAGPNPPADVRRDFILARVGLVYKVLGWQPGAAR